MRILVVIPAVLLVVTAAACPAADPCAADVAYAGGGTDEVYATMTDAKTRAKQDPQGATITSPTANEKLPKADLPTFTWTSPIHVASLFPTEVARPRHAPSLLDFASSVIIPSARAHEPPVSSDVYLVEAAIPGAQCPVTVVTTDLSAKLDAAHWAEITAATGKTITLSITSAYLQVGRIQEGPYEASPVTFEVSP
jgi:hypothetical protein